VNEEDMNNIRHEVSRYFRNKESEHLKDDISKLEEIVKTRAEGNCIDE
jgi:hypothetical protein